MSGDEATVREIGPDKFEIPSGYVGNINDEQLEGLVKMWELFFGICDRATGKGTKGGKSVEDTDGDVKEGSNNVKDLKKSGIPEDDKAKDAAKQASEEQGMNELLTAYGPDSLREAFWGLNLGDNPDGNMLKFIRARKWDVDRGLAMMATCLKWRLDTDVDLLVTRGDLGNAKEIPKFIDQQKSGKVFAYGFTTKGQPICYVIMKYHSLWGQPAASMQKFIVTQMESFHTMLMHPNDKATIIFDLKGFGIKQMDIQNLMYLVKMLESYYPESLGTMYVSNAPWIFWGFWKAIKNFLDPVVRNKVVFINGPKDCGDDIPIERVIEFCGGQSKAPFKFVDPQEGENHLTEDKDERDKRWKRHMAITEEFERVTREWCAKKGKDEQLTEQRRVLVKKIRLSYFEHDPYYRGLNQYQRDGTQPEKHQGITSFQYENKGETVRQVLGFDSSRKTMERELAEIADGATCDEVEAKTKKMLEDGSWGDWRVNDNPPEVQKKAIDSLKVNSNAEEAKASEQPPPGLEAKAGGAENGTAAAPAEEAVAA